MSNSAASLQGKAALATGAVTGIGKAIAAAGARVVVNHDHTPEPAEKVVVGIETAGGPRSRSPPTSAAGPNARRWSSSFSPAGCHAERGVS